MLQVEQINLGFSGNGIGDLELANYIVELSPSIVVLDYWANPSVESYAKTLPEFVRIIRAGLDNTPIIITSTFANPGREEEQRSKDEISKNLVQAMNKQGDDRMFYIDGLLNEDEVDGLVDGRHLNSYGFFLVAKRMSNYISRENLLNLSGNKLELQ
jgi:hypothetical protein